MTKKNKFPNVVFYCREGIGHAGFEIRSHDVSIELLKYGIRSHIISFKGYHKNIPEDKLSFLRKVYINFQIVFKLIKLKPDILILQRVNYHFLAAIIYKIFFRPCFILDVDDWEVRENLEVHHSGFSSSFADNLTKFLARRSNYVIVSSKFLYDYLKEYAKKIIKIPSGVNANINFLNRNYQNIERCVWIGSLHSGRKEVFKDVKELVKAFSAKALNHMKLLIVARGDLVGELHQFIKSLNNPAIQLMTNVPRADVSDILSNCHIGLLPLFEESKFYKAKSPVKLFEYMAAGVISISADQGEVKEIIDNNTNGFIVSNHQEMVEKINNLSLKSESEICSIVHSASNTFLQHFSLKAVVCFWNEIIARLLKKESYS